MKPTFKQLPKLFSALLLLCLLAACGGGADGSSVSVSVPSTASPPLPPSSTAQSGTYSETGASTVEIGDATKDDPGFPVGEFELTRAYRDDSYYYRCIGMSREEFFAQDRGVPNNMGFDRSTSYYVNEIGQVFLTAKNSNTTEILEEGSILFTLPNVSLYDRNYSYYYFIIDNVDLYVMDLYTGISMHLFTFQSPVQIMRCDNIVSYFWLDNGEIWRIHMPTKTADLITVSQDLNTYKDYIFNFGVNYNNVCSWWFEMPENGLPEEELALGVTMQHTPTSPVWFAKSYHATRGYVYVSQFGGIYALDEVTQEILDEGKGQ